MIVSSNLTPGELSFLFNVSRQILAYGGPFLIGLIILASVPRLAPVDTHNTVNQVVGGSTATSSKIRWILNRVRRNTTNSDPTPPTALFLILTLSIIYNLFLSLSDVAHIGIYSCSDPNQPGGLESPASINSESAARSLMTANMLNGTILSKVGAQRCDSSSLLSNNMYNCTSWNSSTYADPTFFTGINSTDSEVLLSRQLGSSLLCPNLNTFYLGPDVQRLAQPTISDGIAINPHWTGVQIITGVPQLSPNENVTIPQTMAIEVEVGCLDFGFDSFRVMEKDEGIDLMYVDPNMWGEYVGPDYLHDVLLESAKATRAYLQPFFNQTILSLGAIQSLNSSSATFSRAAKVTQFHLPYQDRLRSAETSILTNCTTKLREKLGIDPRISDNRNTNTTQLCGYFGIGGSVDVQGAGTLAFSSVICASTTQVNMVSSTISVSATNRTNIISVSPKSSTLKHIRADYIGQCSNDVDAASFLPYERYTLTLSPNGTKSHFISPSAAPPPFNVVDGTGSGGTFISTLNSFLFNDYDFLTSPDYAGLVPLPRGFAHLTVSDMSVGTITLWIGQVVASIASASIIYNPWAALQVPRVSVIKTGANATCYDIRFALCLVPLALATISILILVLILLLRRSFFGSQRVQKAYSELSYSSVPEGTLLVWERDAQGGHSWLQVVEKGYAITGHPSDTTLQFLKSHHSDPA